MEIINPSSLLTELVATSKKLDLWEKAKAWEIWPTDNYKSSDDQVHNARMKLLRTIALAMQGKGESPEAGDPYRTLLSVNVKVRRSTHRLARIRNATPTPWRPPPPHPSQPSTTFRSSRASKAAIPSWRNLTAETSMRARGRWMISTPPH